MGDTSREKRKRACLSSYSHLGNSYSLSRDTKRGFFIPSNRVSDCRVAVAPRPPPTRNEDKPDSPTVKGNEGMEKR